ncbi:MAG TPA: phosphohistidine phosphatase SixA [Candidatus Binataceae bacterium]|nr:phosphohistidine phosphatase SixA [Candidatus Binataceae bacterium]
MILYLQRHAIAEVRTAGGDDGARKLTARGRDRMRNIAGGIRTLGVKFDAILTSPLARATETAEIVAGAYQNIPPPQVLPALATGVSPADAAAALKPFARHGHVMVVGHEPQLSELASLLLTGSTDGLRINLKKGGCIAIDLPNGPGKAGAELRWILTPRQLRRMRK